MELTKLRFLDENNEPYPDWEQKRLGDLGEIVGGGTPSTAIEDYWDGDIDWYSPAEIKSKYTFSSVKKITEKGLKNSSAKLIPAGTVIVTTRATLGKMSILTKEGTTNQGFQNVVTGSSLLNEFLYYGQPKIEKYCIEGAGGSTFKEISKTEFAKYPLLLPSLPEQEKIASFLSALDERIEAYSALLGLSREEKKAYSQRLFSRSLRFNQDDGSPYPDWEKKRLGEIAEKIKARNKNLDFENVFTNSAAHGIVSQTDYFYKDIAVKGNTKNYYIIEPLSFLYNPRISLHAPYGPIHMNKTGKTGIASPLYKAFRLTGDMNKSYLDIFFRSNLWNSSIKRAGNSGAREDRLNLSDAKFFDMPIPLPSLPEQEKIASFLSALDERIENLTLKLEALKQEKKAYSQRMLG